jgi:hypothetical protein
MSETMQIYVSETASTPRPLVEPGQDLDALFPWRTVSSGEVADQAWFWTPEWQAGEREADEDIAAGRTTFFASTEDFLTALDDEIA